MSAARPRTSSGVRGLALPLAPEYDSRKKAMTRTKQAWQGRTVHLSRGSRPPGQGGHDGNPRDGASRPCGSKECGHDREHHRHGDHQPWQSERADHVVGTRLDTRPVCQPDHQAQDSSNHGADDTCDDAVGPHDETDVLVGGAQGTDHPDRAQPALASTVKPPTATRPMRSIPRVSSAKRDGLGLSGLFEATDAGVSTFAPIEAALTRVRRTGASPGPATRSGPAPRGRTRRAGSGGFSTMPTTRLDVPSSCQRSPILSLKSTATPWVTATWPGSAGKLPEIRAEHGLSEGTVRILGAQVVGVMEPGTAHGLVLDDLDTANRCLSAARWAGSFGLGPWKLTRSWAVPKPVLAAGGVSVATSHQGSCSDRYHDERNNEQLLSPLAPEEAPCPATHGAACRRASVV